MRAASLGIVAVDTQRQWLLDREAVEAEREADRARTDELLRRADGQTAAMSAAEQALREAARQYRERMAGTGRRRAPRAG